MATRGHLGGLAAAAPQAVRVLDAAGCDVVLIETVGVGQSEVEVAGLADTTVVLLAPGMGDAIQAAKAGILEIGDVYCVNKADRDGADVTARELRTMLAIGRNVEGEDAPEWRPPHPQDGGLPRRGHRRAAGRDRPAPGLSSWSTTSSRCAAVGGPAPRSRPSSSPAVRAAFTSGAAAQQLDRLAADVVSGRPTPTPRPPPCTPAPLRPGCPTGRRSRRGVAGESVTDAAGRRWRSLPVSRGRGLRAALPVSPPTPR